MQPVILALSIMLACLASPAWSYDEISVSEGGTISGKVTITGGKPVPKGFNLITFPDPVYCGRISTGTGWRLLGDFRIAPDGGLKDVVVMLVDVTKGKPFAFTPPTIEARDCRFLPFVTVVRDRHEVVVMNMDPVMHDIQAYETSHLGPRVLFNTPLPMNPHHRREIGANSHEHLAGQPPLSWFSDTIRVEYAENAGAFLSLGMELPEPIRVVLFQALTAAWLLALFVYLIRSPNESRSICLGGCLVLGGGVGNLLVRMLHEGRVIDFMKLGLGNLRTGIFNVADVCITAGVLVLVIESLRGRHQVVAS